MEYAPIKGAATGMARMGNIYCCVERKPEHPVGMRGMEYAPMKGAATGMARMGNIYYCVERKPEHPRWYARDGIRTHEGCGYRDGEDGQHLLLRGTEFAPMKGAATGNENPVGRRNLYGCEGWNYAPMKGAATGMARIGYICHRMFVNVYH